VFVGVGFFAAGRFLKKKKRERELNSVLKDHHQKQKKADKKN